VVIAQKVRASIIWAFYDIANEIVVGYLMKSLILLEPDVVIDLLSIAITNN